MEYHRAQALISDAQYSDGANKMAAWMSRHGTTISGLEGVVAAYIMTENFDAALPWALKWKDEDISRDKALKAHKILEFIYQKLEQTEARRSNLEFMIQNWPDDKTVYIARSNFLRSQSDKVEEYKHYVQMYDRGMLETEDELYYFISMHLDNDNFEKAREVFDKETKAGRIPDNPDHSLLRFLAGE